jgi:hypothetical protein
MWKSGWLAVVAVAAAQLVGGCSSDGSSPKVPVGKYCQSDPECGGGGFCLENKCSKPCKEDRDCSQDDSGAYPLVCGVDPQGASSCVPDCEHNDGYVCLDGVSTACAQAPDDQCETCGCPNSQRCEPGVGCMPKRAAGEPCKSDDDCNTDNCSDFAGVCRVPIGSACTASNCDTCLSAEGWSYCSKECGGNYECAGGLCLGYAGVFYCRPPCSSFSDDSCPGQSCKLFIDEQTRQQAYHCDCANSGDCKWLEEPHPLGSTCRGDSECAGQLCDRVVTRTDELGRFEFGGLCSQPCKTSAECGAGFACAAVGQPHCLPTCETSCGIGSCVSLPTTEGQSAGMCWVKRAEGSCWEPNDCQSGSCAGGNCAPAGGQPNGASCSGNDDCVSKSCIGGSCRGSALLGESCMASADCAVGTCCTSGANANTCATDCN